MLGKIEFSHPKPRGEGRVWSFMFELQSESIDKALLLFIHVSHTLVADAIISALLKLFLRDVSTRFYNVI